MNVKNDISEELRSVSELVATISRRTPYEVPEGYFLELPVRILRKISAGEQAKSLKFTVPEGYFEGFAQQVLNRIKSSSPAPAREEESEVLPAVLLQAGRRTPYQVPEGYFEGLSPILSVIKDKIPYLVPAGYFEQFPAETTARAIHPAERKGIVRRMSWFRYSAAAVVAGLVLTVGWLRWHQSGSGHGPAIADRMRQNPTEIASMSKVSDEELNSYLADQDTTLAQPIGNLGSSEAALDMSDSDVRNLLGDVPDGELRQYMEEHGEAMNIATN